MAKQIGDTLTLYGKKAFDFLNRMIKPPSEKYKEFKKMYNTTKKVSF